MKTLYVLMANNAEGDPFPIAAFEEEKSAEQLSESIKHVVGGYGIVEIPYVRSKDDLTVNYRTRSAE